MGLLDMMNSRDGVFALSLLDAASPKPVRTSLGTGLLQALMQGNAFQDQQDKKKQEEEERKQRAALQALQMQQLQQAMAAQQAQQQELARQRQLEQQFRDKIPSPQMQASSAALGAGGGPTVENAARIAPVDPLMQLSYEAMRLGQIKPTDYISGLRKDETPLVVGEGAAVLRNGRPIFTNTRQEKPAEPPTDVREYQFAVGQGYKGTYTEWAREMANLKAPRTTTNIVNNTGDRIPPTLIKQQDDLIDKLTVAKSINADLGAIATQIDAGKLKFGPVRNLYNTGKNIAGMSDDESRAFGTFKSTLEKLRNDSLRLNTGVQTEGDAQRAWNELFQNINDTKFVRQRLDEINRINQRAAQLHEFRLNVLRQNSGAGSLPQPTIEPAIEPAPNKVRRYNPETGRIE